MIGYPALKLRGGYAEIGIPLCRRGVIEFDLKIDHRLRGIGLFMDFYNVSLFWHDYCNDWRRYFPEPTARRMKNFNVEPVGHRRIGPVRKGVWSHYKICFDTDKDRVEYYRDNMNDPVFIDGTVAVLGRSEYLGGKLRIGNWGVTKGPMKFLIDNIRISSADKASGITGKVPRESILVFNGLSHNRYNIPAALVKTGIGKERIVNYFLENPKPALTPRNKFFSTALPGLASAAKAKCFVLVDFPFGPDNVIPDYIVKDMLDNVRQGARLVVLGGLCSLGKGEYQDSSLAYYLPVKLKDPWQIRKADKPLPIVAVAKDYRGYLASKPVPCVVYYHDLATTREAEVLLGAGDRPLLVSRKLGQGEIVVFLGTTCGTVPANYPQPLFWKWSGWPELARRIVDPPAH